AHVAARRHGGAHARVGADPRRHHGHGRRLPDRAHRRRVRQRPRRRRHGGVGGGAHGADGRHRGRGPGRHQEDPRLVDHLAGRLHGGGGGRRRLLGRHLPRAHPRLLQGAAVPGRRLGDPRAGRRAGRAQDGRPGPQDAHHRRHGPDRDAGHRRRAVPVRLLQQGRHPRRAALQRPAGRLRRRGALRAADGHGRPHRLLHVPLVLPGVRRRAALQGGVRARPRVARGHDRAARDPGRRQRGDRLPGPARLPGAQLAAGVAGARERRGRPRAPLHQRRVAAAARLGGGGGHRPGARLLGLRGGRRRPGAPLRRHAARQRLARRVRLRRALPRAVHRPGRGGRRRHRRPRPRRRRSRRERQRRPDPAAGAAAGPAAVGLRPRLRLRHAARRRGAGAAGGADRSVRVISLYVVLVPLAVAPLVALLRADRPFVPALAVLGGVATFALALFLPGSEPVDAAWLPGLGVSFALDATGAGAVLVLVAALVMIPTLLVAATRVERNAAGFVALLLLAQAGLNGIFLAKDLIVFYVFWEATLIPALLLLGVYGGERRRQATLKYLVYAVAGSFLMLVSILALKGLSGAASFHVTDLMLVTPGLAPSAQTWLFVGMAVGMVVKLPLWPLHSWLV